MSGVDVPEWLSPDKCQAVGHLFELTDSPAMVDNDEGGVGVGAITLVYAT